jgi:hypothetical protein
MPSRGKELLPEGTVKADSGIMCAVSDEHQLHPGDPDQIDEYRVLSRLGSGGQGVVYLATAPSGERVAIKRLHSAFGDEKSRLQFAKEVAAARRVAPFCTAQVVDARMDGPSPYVVSEYIDGLSLQQHVRHHGPLAGVALQRLAIGTTTALVAIHTAGLVHRDFKPANVMLAADGPRVIDFGVARDLSLETTADSGVPGTLTFMAPEQLSGGRVGPPSDLFAWASVMVFAATGRTLFEAPHAIAVVKAIADADPDLTGVPADLLPVVQRCLSKDPARRPSAQQALVELLGRPAADAEVSDPSGVLAEAAERVLTTGRPRADHRPAVGTWSVPAPTSAIAKVAAAVGVALLVLVSAWAIGRVGTSPSSDRVRAGIDDTVVSGAVGWSPSPQGSTSAGGSRIPAKYRGTWIGSYQVADSPDQARTVQIESDDSRGTLGVSFTGLGCKATLHYMNSSAKYLNLAAETTSDLAGACGQQASVVLQLTAAGELLLTWTDVSTGESRITAVLRPG